MRAHGFIEALTAAAALWPAAGSAQDYPSRPITVVVPFAAGGAFDVLAASSLRTWRSLGQAVIVENMGGGGGTTGVKRVIAAEPDGYTVLFGTVGTHAYNQTIYKKRRYDAVTDFTPVTLFSEQPMVLVARKDLPAEALPDFTALLKTKGDKMQFGSAGVGSTTHLGCALLNSRIGVSITHVAYRGGGPAMNDLIGGQIDYFCGNLGGDAANRQQAGEGHCTAVEGALAADARAQDRPRAGPDGLDVATWTAFFLPKGASKPVVDKLLEITHAAMDSPDTKKRMLEIGVTGVAPERRSPEYLTRFVVEEIDRWEEPIKSGGLQVD